MGLRFRKRSKDVISDARYRIDSKELKERSVRSGAITLFDQAMVVGEGKPHLAALIVLNADAWREFARALALDPADPKSVAAPAALQSARDRVGASLHSFPAYARVRELWLTLEPWTVEDGLITPTLKLKRAQLEQRYAGEIRRLYAGHDVPA